MTTSTVWYRMPAAARVTATGLFALGTGIALSSLYYPADAGSISTMGMAMAGYVAAVGLISAIVAERLVRRDFGSTRRYLLYAGALRSGHLPTGIEPDVWRGWLARSRKVNQQAPVMAVLLMVFGVARGLNHPSLPHLAVAAWLALCTAAIVVNWRLDRGRIARLTEAVDRRAEEH